MTEPVPKAKVSAFLLVIGADGRVKVDDWNGMTAAQQRAVAEYVVSNYRSEKDGCDPSDQRA